VPYPFQKAVQQHATYQLPDFWVPKMTSVQKRGDDPMFGIANEIAYNYLMVFGTIRGDAPNSVGPISTGWVDVPFHADGDSHFNQAEHDAAERMLQHLVESRQINFRGGDVLLLAPFRDIADTLPRLGERFGMDGSKMAGTIHTAQSKEAKVVIMLLGGASDGARNWAAAQPNLLNVAATRTKRILVVIGSHANWSGLRNFNVAAARMPMLSLPPVKAGGLEYLR
jgi:hypothetical protein